MTSAYKKFEAGFVALVHRHLRNRLLIGHSWQASHLALNLGQINILALHTATKCALVATAAGKITTNVNKGRRGGPMSGLVLLDVYDLA